MALGAFGAGLLGGAGINIIIRAVDQFSSEFKRVQTEAEKTGEGFSKLSFVANKVLAPALLGLGTAMVGFAVSSVKAAAEAEPIKRGFKDLAVNAENFLIELTKATEGTVSNFELMKAANNALLLGIDQEALPDMFRAAAIVGQAAGRNTTEAISDITIGIGRQSKLILDNLGILVKAEEAYDNYAISIGKASSDLTENEKRIAFTDAALKALEDRMNSLGGTIEDTLSSNLEKLNATLQNTKEAIGEELAPELTDFAKQIQGASDEIAILAKAMILPFEGLIFAMERASEEGESFGQRLFDIFYQMKGLFAGGLPGLETAREELEMAEQITLGETLAEQEEKLKEIRDIETEGVRKLTEQEKVFGEESEKLRQRFDMGWFTAERYREKQEELNAGVLVAGKIAEVTGISVEKFTEKIEKLNKELGGEIPAEYRGSITREQFESAREALRAAGAASGIRAIEREAVYQEQVRRMEAGLPHFKTVKGKKVEDFIIRPNGEMLEFSPYDTIIGTKSGFGGITVNIERVQGLDATEIAEALQERLQMLISTA